MFGKKPTVSVKDFPTTFQVAENPLSVHADRLVIDGQKRPLELAIFCSEGLAPFGQKEIVICYATKRSAIPQAHFDDIIKFYRTLMMLSQQGQTVGVGGFSGFGDNGPLGFGGALYFGAAPFQFLPQDDDSLVAVFVEAPELQVAMAMGITRVGAILGRLNNFYPVPAWQNCKRDAKLVHKAGTDSMLSKLPALSLSEGYVFLSNNALLFSVSESDRQSLVEGLKQLPGNAPFYLTLQMSEEADGCLSWLPGQTSPVAITPEGSQGKVLNGAFLCVVAEQQTDSAMLVEDGFSLLLTDATQAALFEAFQHGKDSRFLLQGDISALNLQFRP